MASLCDMQVVPYFGPDWQYEPEPGVQLATSPATTTKQPPSIVRATIVCSSTRHPMHTRFGPASLQPL